jgi:hypothetical protein
MKWAKHFEVPLRSSTFYTTSDLDASSPNPPCGAKSIANSMCFNSFALEWNWNLIDFSEGNDVYATTDLDVPFASSLVETDFSDANGILRSCRRLWEKLKVHRLLLQWSRMHHQQLQGTNFKVVRRYRLLFWKYMLPLPQTSTALKFDTGAFNRNKSSETTPYNEMSSCLLGTYTAINPQGKSCKTIVTDTQLNLRQAHQKTVLQMHKLTTMGCCHPSWNLIIVSPSIVSLYSHVSVC